jgi:hypothetical protein
MTGGASAEARGRSSRCERRSASILVRTQRFESRMGAARGRVSPVRRGVFLLRCAFCRASLVETDGVVRREVVLRARTRRRPFDGACLHFCRGGNMSRRLQATQLILASACFAAACSSGPDDASSLPTVETTTLSPSEEPPDSVGSLRGRDMAAPSPSTESEPAAEPEASALLAIRKTVVWERRGQLLGAAVSMR